MENQSFYRQILQDIHDQIDGYNGKAVLSLDNRQLEFSKYAEVLDVFVPFDINRKPLLTKITAAIEKEALSPDFYEQAGDLLHQAMELLDSITFELPCNVSFPKLSISAMIRSAGLELQNDYQSVAEKVIDYMELVQYFDRDKLFITVNMRSFISDDEMERFMETALSHGFHLLMLENCSYPILPFESRWLIDKDLCEIDCNSQETDI